ncbi:MAG: hypothetical protein ACTS73_08390 [Arsenophonus sp. NEOnobi-MAG3]
MMSPHHQATTKPKITTDPQASKEPAATLLANPYDISELTVAKGQK